MVAQEAFRKRDNAETNDETTEARTEANEDHSIDITSSLDSTQDTHDTPDTPNTPNTHDTHDTHDTHAAQDTQGTHAEQVAADQRFPSQENDKSTPQKLDDAEALDNRLKALSAAAAANTATKRKRPIHWADIMIEDLALWQDPVYVYAREKGYLYLSAKRKEEHGVKTLNVTLDSDDPCLAPGQFLLEAFVGYDTVILNNLVGTLGGKGHAYNKQTYELWSLNYIVHEAGTMKMEAYILWKLEVAFRSILLFFVTTTLVSFCMKHTQLHIFQFTIQMRHQSLQRSSLVPVVVSHLLESLVLILVMVGVLLCVAEFMPDKTISLLVLFLMWATELFTLLAIRTHASLKYFPRFVMCCFLLFYVYMFSFPLGFHYIAFLCLSFSIEMLLLYFYIQHEMPAVRNGTINYSRTRAIPIFPRSLFVLLRGPIVIQQQSQQPPPSQNPPPNAQQQQLPQLPLPQQPLPQPLQPHAPPQLHPHAD